MSNYPRYAIYYAPPPISPLNRFGTQLLGHDAREGEDQPFPLGVTGTIPDWRDITSDPRKYGFHATLKAPFALAPGKSEKELLNACADFAATPRFIPVIRPIVDSISGFIAVTPAETSPELIRLASDCVTEFDSFRAPLTEADRERRKPSQLTDAQREHLDRWGYPYVMEEFRFHMTLTGRLPDERREPIVAMLRGHFATLALSTLAIDRIAVFRQDDSAAHFRIIGEWELRSA